MVENGLLAIASVAFTGTVEVSGDKQVQHLQQAAGIIFARLADGVGAEEDVNANGFPALLEFAFGASAPGELFPRPVQGIAVIADVKYLTLTAAVRSNAPALVVVGETSTELGTDNAWDTQDVDHLTTGSLDVPPNTEGRTYHTPMIGATRFLRLRAAGNLEP